MTTVDQLTTDAKNHHQAGNLATAEQLYRQAIQQDRSRPEPHYFLGILCSQQARFDEAVEHLTRAASLQPKNPVFYYALGNAYLGVGDPEQAASRYRRAIRLHPQFVEAQVNLGIAMERAGRIADAERAFRDALRQQPDTLAALVNLGNICLRNNEIDEAERLCRRAIEIDPTVAEAHNNLGNIHQRFGRIDEAIASFTEALDLDPKHVEALNNLGSAHRARGEDDKGADCFRRAIELAPERPILKRNLGNALLDQNRTEEAIEQYRAALADDPGFTEARWRMHLALPVLYEAPAEIDRWRQRFADGLETLIVETDLTDKDQVVSAADTVGGVTNFYLNYQGRDDRALQSRYGTFVYEILSRTHPKWAKPRAMHKPGKDGRIRVAFVSAHFRYHAATRMSLAFIRDADRARFKFYGYHIGRQCDDATAVFEQSFDEWHQRTGEIDAFCQRVASDRPHVLIYTDVGMDPLITKMAGLRLAPVQCAHWGHPITTGSPVIDCFLSSDLMEPDDGEAHYTERLIRLPNLGVRYPRPELPAEPKSREAFDLPVRDEGVVYLCCQSLYKYLPQHDHLLPEIAQHVPNAIFAFISAQVEAVTQQFRARLERAFDDAGLDPHRHLRLFRRLDAKTDFLALHMASDIALDSLDWSGGNTTIESLTAGLPVVTLPGRFLRGRHAYGMLRMLGIDETIARDKSDYVDIAARLGGDVAWRNEIANRISGRLDRIFDDESPVRALEDQIVRWVDGND